MDSLPIGENQKYTWGNRGVVLPANTEDTIDRTFDQQGSYFFLNENRIYNDFAPYNQKVRAKISGTHIKAKWLWEVKGHVEGQGSRDNLEWTDLQQLQREYEKNCRYMIERHGSPWSPTS